MMETLDKIIDERCALIKQRQECEHICGTADEEDFDLPIYDGLKKVNDTILFNYCPKCGVKLL
jgi:hypothetical protein